MSVLWPILLSLAVLVATGWWIGHQIARDTALVRSEPLTIVMAPGTLPGAEPERALRAALRRAAPSIDSIVFLEERPTEGTFMHLARSAQTRQRMISCRPGTLHTQSCALQYVPIATHPGQRDWQSLAMVILRHMQGPVLSVQDGFAGPEFECQYLAAWHHMQRADNNTRSAYHNLSAALDQWPADRDDEKSVALANLAVLCLRLPEPPATRLPRLLEGLDAARRALRMRIDLPADARISGLRALIADLRRAIAGMSGGKPASGEAPAAASLAASACHPVVAGLYGVFVNRRTTRPVHPQLLLECGN